MYRSGQRVVTQAIQKYLGSSYDVVKTVYDNLTLLLGLQNLADNADKVVDVADNLDDVTSVADNLTDVSAVADNIVAITEVNDKVDDFNTKYLGSYASAPTVDGNGDPLVEGATYWDTTLNAMFVYTGSQWVKPTGTGIVDVDTFTGDGSTASFPLDVSPASKTNTSVFIDGVYQEKDTYSVSTNLITFNTAPNDEASIEVIVNEITNFITGTQTETHTLTSGQTVVNLTNSPAFASFHIQGEDVDSQRLDLGTDYTLDLLTNTITLTNSYPENTVLKMLYGYDDDISVELAPLNQAILDHVNDTTDAHDISAIGGVADRLALSGNAVFTDTTQFATGETKDGVLSDSTLLALVGTTTKCRTEGFHAGTTVGEGKYKFLNGADSAAAGYVDGVSRFQIRALDVYACLINLAGSPESYGHIPSDGSDITAFQSWLDNPSKTGVLTNDISYDLGGNAVTIPSGFDLVCNKSSKLINGSILANHTSGSGITIGDLVLEDCESTIGGTIGESNHATNYNIKSITSKDGIVRLQYMKDFEIGSIVSVLPTYTEAQQRAVGWTSLYDGTINTIYMEGYYSMGFETAGNGSQPSEFASRNVHVNSIISKRNASSFDENGHHGVYLHGNYNLKVDYIFSTGYDIVDQGVSNDFKFRDNHNCEIGKVTCLTAQLASDANSTTLNSLENNVIRNMILIPDPDNLSTVGKATMTTSGSGFFNDNEIHNFTGELGTSGTLAVGAEEAIRLTGSVNFVASGNLQLSNVIFRDAIVDWDNASTNYYTRQMIAYNTTFKDIVRIQSSLETYHCNLDGGLRLETGGGSRTLNQHHTTVKSDWDTILSSGTVDAELVSVDIQVTRPSSTLRPNGTLRYRFVSFDNGYYLATNDDADFVTI